MNYFKSERTLMSWLGSEGGRRFLLGFGGAVGPIIGTTYWLHHALGINQTKQWIQMYSDGIPQKASPAVTDLVAEALADCEIVERDARKIRWFTAFGFEPMHKGQVGFPKGALIGLPKTFSYHSTDDINRTEIKMYRNRAIPWRSEAGEALTNALVLSDEAKKFAIAREIHAVCWNYALIKTLILASPIPALTGFVAWFNEKFGIHRYPLKMRVAMFTLWGIFGFCLMVGLFDAAARFYEQAEDEEASRLSIAYAKGGVEYYSKALLRNRALRELLGNSGKGSYNEEGDVRYWIRSPHMKLTVRKKICEKELELHLEEKLNPSPLAAKEDSKKVDLRSKQLFSFLASQEKSPEKVPPVETGKEAKTVGVVA